MARLVGTQRSTKSRSSTVVKGLTEELRQVREAYDETRAEKFREVTGRFRTTQTAIFADIKESWDNKNEAQARFKRARDALDLAVQSGVGKRIERAMALAAHEFRVYDRAKHHWAQAVKASAEARSLEETICEREDPGRIPAKRTLEFGKKVGAILMEYIPVERQLAAASEISRGLEELAAESLARVVDVEFHRQPEEGVAERQEKGE